MADIRDVCLFDGSEQDFVQLARLFRIVPGLCCHRSDAFEYRMNVMPIEFMAGTGTLFAMYELECQ